MQYGIVFTSGSPRDQVELASRAEAAGWDGVFTWDGIAVGEGDVWDPWALLGAMAMSTQRVRLGAMVLAAPRRRPWKLLKEAVTVDHLSGGRLVLPVGLGAVDDAGFRAVGEAMGARVRAERLDETLAILDGLQSARPFAFEGVHYRFGELTLRPRPVQQPRIPLWIVGAWPHERSMRRAVAWDGLVVQAPDPGGVPTTDPANLAEITAWVHRARADAGRDGPYDIVVSGTTPADDPALAAAATRRAAESGATWWVEADWENASFEGLRRRVLAGPPRA